MDQMKKHFPLDDITRRLEERESDRAFTVAKMLPALVLEKAARVPEGVAILRTM